MKNSSDQEFSDNEIDIESACSPANSSGNFAANDSKRYARIQHNALERRRRDNIKDMYTSLKEEIPNFSNDRASRAQILKKTIEQIQDSSAEVSQINEEIERIEKANATLSREIEQQMGASGANIATIASEPDNGQPITAINSQ